MGLDLQREDPASWNLTRPGIVSRFINAMSRRERSPCSRIPSEPIDPGCGDLVSSMRSFASIAAPSSWRSEAAGNDRSVIGDIGPSGTDLPGAITEQAAILIDSGVDALILERFGRRAAHSALQELRPAVPDSISLIISLANGPVANTRKSRRDNCATS